MLNDVQGILVANKPLDFVITVPKENEEIRKTISYLMRSACHMPDCKPEETPNPFEDLDTGIPLPTRVGIVVHVVDRASGVPLSELAHVLGQWFITSKTSDIPDGLKKYKSRPGSQYL